METPALDTFRLLQDFNRPLPIDFVARKLNKKSSETRIFLQELADKNLVMMNDKMVQLQQE